MDDLTQEEELTTVKEEMAFMHLDPALAEVSF